MRSQRAFTALTRHGAQPFSTLRQKSGLHPGRLRAALLVLLQHGLAEATLRADPPNMRGEIRTEQLYEGSVARALGLLRGGRRVAAAGEAAGPAGALVAAGLLENGRMTAAQMEAAAMEHVTLARKQAAEAKDAWIARSEGNGEAGEGGEGGGQGGEGEGEGGSAPSPEAASSPALDAEGLPPLVEDGPWLADVGEDERQILRLTRREVKAAILDLVRLRLVERAPPATLPPREPAPPPAARRRKAPPKPGSEEEAALARSAARAAVRRAYYETRFAPPISADGGAASTASGPTRSGAPESSASAESGAVAGGGGARSSASAQGSRESTPASGARTPVARKRRTAGGTDSGESAVKRARSASGVPTPARAASPAAPAAGSPASPLIQSVARRRAEDEEPSRLPDISAADALWRINDAEFDRVHVADLAAAWAAARWGRDRGLALLALLEASAAARTSGACPAARFSSIETIFGAVGGGAWGADAPPSVGAPGRTDSAAVRSTELFDALDAAYPPVRYDQISHALTTVAPARIARVRRAAAAAAWGAAADGAQEAELEDPEGRLASWGDGALNGGGGGGDAAAPNALDGSADGGYANGALSAASAPSAGEAASADGYGGGGGAGGPLGSGEASGVGGGAVANGSPASVGDDAARGAHSTTTSNGSLGSAPQGAAGAASEDDEGVELLEGLEALCADRVRPAAARVLADGDDSDWTPSGAADRPARYAPLPASLLRAMREDLVAATVRDSHGQLVKRCWRALALAGPLEQRGVAELAVMDRGAARRALNVLLRAGYARVQEAPRGADRAPSRTFFLFRAPLGACFARRAQDGIQAVARVLMRAEAEQANAKELASTIESVKKGLAPLSAVDPDAYERSRKVDDALRVAAIRIDRENALFEL